MADLPDGSVTATWVLGAGGVPGVAVRKPELGEDKFLLERGRRITLADAGEISRDRMTFIAAARAIEIGLSVLGVAGKQVDRLIGVAAAQNLVYRLRQDCERSANCASL